ncbi:MAG TPA: CaiB/BaiF CoA-transferase family protein [Acidiphilium sp.]|nr:MAG: carnitine dehydratase [Acidiphilium sp. 21-60-14]OYV92189.1 MAG: carnitine dehydratase [Acidiphilium sp. 37-60-79]HQT87447.1 CaiB/BaiF CoA-transferase family protein [Acidiphilium sp.]HQU23153.1 CaiB/BaiF CoA-transferase family protein [Acidiphilium sp.]
MRAQRPLAGVRVIEIEALGPVPFCAMMLADLGAEIVQIRRPDKPQLIAVPPERDPVQRGRTVVVLDLKSEVGRAAVQPYLARADILIEGFRPGVMERLGLGPEPVRAAYPRLIYGRMTGFGQSGPLAARAGHDLTYLALTGALHAIGRAGERPVPPLNLVADYGGGAMLLAVGLLAALVQRGVSGRGCVVDAAMIDGASLLMTPCYAMLANHVWADQRGVNLLDGGAPFYDTYETADGRYVAVAALEPQFFARLATTLALDQDLAGRQYDRQSWPGLRAALTAKFRSETRDYWAALFEPLDACVAPVLSLQEAVLHPHNQARGVHVREDAGVRPAAAPRFAD